MRFFLYISIFVTVLLGQWWLGVLIGGYYSWRYVGYELLAIGVLIDGYAGQFAVIPYYTIGATLLVLLVNVLRPKLIVYTDE